LKRNQNSKISSEFLISTLKKGHCLFSVTLSYPQPQSYNCLFKMNESDNILCDNFGILVYELVLWPAWTRQSHTCLTQHFSKIQVIVENLNEKQKEISQRIMILMMG
jgi:ribonuclease HIII